MADDKTTDAVQPIIIKKIIVGGGHHGGAWKVAYADFVTAMMAFFLLLWLLSVATDEQKNAISNYFDPSHPKIAESVSGSDGLMGGVSISTVGAMTTDLQPLTNPTPTGGAGEGDAETKEDGSNAETEAKAEEIKDFEDAQEELKKALEAIPELAAISDQILIDMTPDGMRIQIIDKDGKSMFESGSATMLQRTVLLIGTVTGAIKDLPNTISIRGHTDSSNYAPGATYTNWELSADRANATRRTMENFGFDAEKIGNVVGKSDTDPLIKDNPSDPQNRRLSIILLHQDFSHLKDEEKKSATPTTTKKSNTLPGPARPIPVGTYRKTPGAVEFP